MKVGRDLYKVPDKDKYTDYSSVLQAIQGNLGSTPLPFSSLYIQLINS